MSFVFAGFKNVVYQVLAAVVPLAIAAVVAQFALLRMGRDEVRRIVIGLLFSAVGLAFFLHGVHIGFMPAGERIGQLLGASNYAWLLVPLGVWLGLASALAEPAVLVLADEVERVSSGSINKRFLLLTLAVGVGLFVGLAMLRVLLDIPLMAVLLPGYIYAFLLIPVASPAFASIAFDSGVVATGPMTVTFVLAVALGAAEAVGRDPVLSGFGLVSFVALAPTISVITVGALIEWQRKRRKQAVGGEEGKAQVAEKKA